MPSKDFKLADGSTFRSGNDLGAAQSQALMASSGAVAQAYRENVTGYGPGQMLRTKGNPRDSIQFMERSQVAQYSSMDRGQMGTYMGQSWPRHPIPVFCDGWKSDTLQLQRHGYTFMVEKDESMRRYRIAIGKAGARSMIMIDEMYYERWLQDNRPIEFHGEFITAMEVQETRVRREEERATLFVQKDMNDAYWCEREAMMTSRRIDVTDLFPQSNTAPESEIILPDAQTVTEVLDLLLEKQLPRSAEVRNQQRKRERKVATILQLEEDAA